MKYTVVKTHIKSIEELAIILNQIQLIYSLHKEDKYLIKKDFLFTNSGPCVMKYVQCVSCGYCDMFIVSFYEVFCPTKCSSFYK